jgi:signal transduction histidine kinase
MFTDPVPVALPIDTNVLYLGDERALWACTETGGIFRVVPRAAEPMRLTPDWPVDRFLSDGHRAGDPWLTWEGRVENIGQSLKMIRSVDGSIFIPPAELPAGPIIGPRVAGSKRGGVWIASRRFLVRWNDGAVVESVSIPQEGFPGHIPVFEDDDGGLWWHRPDQRTAKIESGAVAESFPGRPMLQTSDGAIWSRYNGQLCKYFEGKVDSFSVEQGIPRGELRMAAEDQAGRVWITTRGGGLICVDSDRIHVLTRDDGLIDNTLGGILYDGSRLWINSNRGVFVARVSDLVDFIEGRVPIVNCQQIDYSESAGNWAAVGLDGRFYFESLGGIISFDPTASLEPERSAPAEILSLEAGNVSYPAAQDFRLPLGVRDVAIRYTAPTLIDPAGTQFRYRMSDLEQDWTLVGSRRAAYYTRLPPGTHRFEVTSGNLDSEWQAPVEAITIVIPHRVSEMTSVRAAGALAVLLLALLAYRARSADQRRHLEEVTAESAAREEAELMLRDMGRRLMNAQEDERRRIARDLHDDINQRLSLLAVQMQMLKGTENDGIPAMVKSAQELSTDIHRISHALNPARLEQLGLEAALEGLCEEVERSSKVKVFLESEQPLIQLDTSVALSLFRIAQEALHNAVKYSGAETLTVRLLEVDGALELRVTDAGIGFDLDSRHGRGLGLTSMVERAKAIGGELEIRSGIELGTEVIARVPPERM